MDPSLAGIQANAKEQAPWIFEYAGTSATRTYPALQTIIAAGASNQRSEAPEAPLWRCCAQAGSVQAATLKQRRPVLVSWGLMRDNYDLGIYAKQVPTRLPEARRQQRCSKTASAPSPDAACRWDHHTVQLTTFRQTAQTRMKTTHFFRAAVADPRGRALSSVWQFSSIGDELYVGVRGLAHQFKASIHSSGKSRHAFVTQEVSDRFQSPGKDRAISKWETGIGSPAPQLLYQVVIPEAALGTNLSDPLAAEVVRLAPALSDHLLVLSLLMFQGEEQDLLQPGSTMLHRWALPMGHYAGITEHSLPIDREVLLQMAALMRPTTAALEDERGENFEHRLAFPMQPQNGVGQCWDIHLRQFDMWLTFVTP